MINFKSINYLRAGITAFLGFNTLVLILILINTAAAKKASKQAHEQTQVLIERLEASEKVILKIDSFRVYQNIEVQQMIKDFKNKQSEHDQRIKKLLK